MTAATEATAVSAPDTVVGRSTVGALARAEIRYTARNPVLWLGVAASGLVAWWLATDGTFTGGKPVTDGYALWEWLVAPLALAAFLVGNWAALRERPSTTAELFTNTPARRWDRTLALLLAAVVPAVLGFLLIAGQWVAVVARGGVELGTGRWTSTFTPTPLELLGAPLGVACAFVSGVALARLVRSRAVGAVVGFVGWMIVWVTFWLWLTAPFGVFAVSRSSLVTAEIGTDPSAAEIARWAAVDPADGFNDQYVGGIRDLGVYGLHLVYVVGLVLVLAGVALARSGRDRRTRPVLLAGLVLVAVAVGVQFLVHEGARAWLGLM